MSFWFDHSKNRWRIRIRRALLEFAETLPRGAVRAQAEERHALLLREHYNRTKLGRGGHTLAEALERLLAAFDDKEAAALARMAFYTGLRWVSELLPLDQSSIRRLKRQRWLYVGETKNGTPRMVPVHPAIAADLKRLPFTRPWREYYAAFEAARKRAGLAHVRMHDLRHSLASEIISRGGTLADVQAALHHKSVASARRYAHLYPERLRHILLKVGRK